MRTYKELEQSSPNKQAEFLLSVLVRCHAAGSFNAYNLNMPPWPLASAFPQSEAQAVTELLFGAPFKWLENNGLIRHTQYQNYVITPAGQKAAQNATPSFFANQEIMAAFPVLHEDFRDYSRYFYENKLKEAVAAAFERYENKLNEVRDSRGSAKAKSQQGKPLVYTLFGEKTLVRPCPKLDSSDPSYEQGLTGLMAGALGWIRNPYTHEKHNLPDLTPAAALELLFVASYLMRMLELSTP